MLKNLTKKQKRMLKRILIAFCLYLFVVIVSLPTYLELFCFLAIYVYIANDILIKAVKNIKNGQVFDENFLMAIASIGAFILGEYSEAVAVILFYQVGEWFQSYAVSRSRQSISDLMDIRPDYANVEVDGKLEQVDPYEVMIGQTIVVQPGERIPLDGIIIEGDSSIDTSALTGESIPRTVHVKDEVISGCINQTGVLKIQVEKEFEESTVSKILELVENASDRKSQSEEFITKFARYYTPIVVYSALALAVIPSLILGQWTTWIYRALTFLVISCPCALVISVPLSFFGGIGGASSRGILVKGSTYLESLATVDTIVFDKTGTLTKGNFIVTEIVGPQEILGFAAKTEFYSNHPIALSIKGAYGKDIVSSDVSNVEEIAGHGVKAIIDGHSICVGNRKLVADAPEVSTNQTIVYVSVDGQYAGHILIADEIKPGAKEAISHLKDIGVESIVMLTGDNADVANDVAQKLGITEVHSQLLPGQKVECVEELLKEHSVSFVGDGINDAPVLMRSDVGIAMGALGSDAAIEAADIVLMDDHLENIVTAIQISKKTLRIVRQNIIFAIGIKVFILILGALGYANMWAAVFADVGVAFLAILNAMRCMRTKNI